ncbi:MAG: hypothetical protein RIB53_02500 [Roseitalea porphyridii]|jgi:hypothetical protein|uniref:hypothetical protein n=1 Tax=Roseitalea porphyridii TaxID=1852022 RepID=UPI0032EE58D9
MEPIVFAMFIMGCGHNLDVCRPVDTSTQQFETRAACEEAIPAAARDVTGFPTAIGACVGLSATQASARPDYLWYFAADGRLIVEPKDEAIQLAGGTGG